MTLGSVSMRSLARTTFWVAVFSSVVNVLLAVVGDVLSRPPSTFGPYQYHSVVGLTAALVVAAAFVYAAMRRYIADVAKANRYFTYISITVLVVSFYPDVAMPWSTDPDQIGWTYGIVVNLMLMHVVSAVLVLYYFTKRPVR